MKPRFLSLLLATIGTAVFATNEPMVRNLTTETPGVEFVSGKPDASGIVQVNAGEVAVVPVLRDLQPGLKPAPYVLRGEVKYEGVGGTGFLEMWSVFPPQRPGEPEGRYFTRALGEFGPMQRLQRNSAWREFSLPFNPEGTNATPVSLELNVVLPDGGSVWLRNLQLTQWEAAMKPAWTDDRKAAGLVAGLFGAALGILGGTIGTCLRKGKGRGLAQIALVLFLTLGVVCAMGVVWVVATRHWTWLVTFAVPAALVFGLLPWFRTHMATRFGEAELRRMQAADA